MELIREKKRIVLEFDSEEDAIMVQKALDIHRYKKLVRQSQGNEEDALKLASDLKQEWWDENKHNFTK